MNLKSLLDGPTLFAIIGVVGFAIWLVWPRRRRRRRAPERVGPTGVGAALAFALDGELDRARSLLTQHVRVAGADQPDAVIGLIAVLRAQGDFVRAAAIVRGLRVRQPAAWIDALCVRLCLDAGQVERAAGFVDARTPADLAIAALIRAGRWSDALARMGRGAPPLAEAAAQAGWAASLLAEGEERAGRKRLKRAHALAPESAAVLAVLERHASRPADRAAAGRALAKRLGRTLEATDDIDPGARELIEATDAQVGAGDVEAALGGLRDALDRMPESVPLRRRYERLLLEHGAPEDWRTALAERSEIAIAVEQRAPAPLIGCRACRLRLSHPVFVCPRCDRFDTVAALDGQPSIGVEPSLKGARLDTLG